MDAGAQLRERLKLLLTVPTFIGDLSELYQTKFKESLDVDGGLLNFVDSCDYLKLRGSYVEYSDSESEPVADNLVFGTLEGRLKFLLPSTRALFYERLPHLYKLCFGETFECGSNLLHFIENCPYLEITSYVFVKYSVASKTPPSPGNPRHKQFLTRRFIYLLRLFPKSPSDLIKIYKEQFGEDLQVHPRILPAIFRNFLKSYFMLSVSNMIYYATPAQTPEVPEIPSKLLEPNSDPSGLVLERIIYLKYQMMLEPRYLQFMYCDIFGEPINDFTALERFISTPDQPPFGAFDRALVWLPGGKQSSNEVIKELLSKGPMKISDLFNAWSSGKELMAEIFRENNAFVEILLHVPGVLILSETVSLADSSLDYVHRQLERLVDGNVKLNNLPGLFKKAYGYTIPDDYLLREYVVHTATLRIDGGDNVIKKIPEIPTPSTSSRGSSLAGDNSVPNGSGDLDAQQKSDVVKLLGRRATRIDKIKLLYERRFRRELKVNTKLSSWLQTIDGIRCDIKNQVVYSAKLNEAQAQVIILVMERKEINFEDIPAECKKKFEKDLVYKGRLKPWLCNIPGINISPTQICTYIQPLCGGSTLNLSEKKLGSTLSKSTPDIRPRSQEELVIDIIIANPNSTINDFRKLYIATHGKPPSYEGKLKTYLLSIPGVCVSPNDRINMQALDVATNAKERIYDILKDGEWVSVDTFAEVYKKQFGIAAVQTWIRSRQKEIEFLMLLNQKIRYKVLDNATCLKYVKHLANLCGGLTMDQVKSFFPIAYGFALPEKMLSLIIQLHPTGKVETGPATKLKVEILNELKTLTPAQRRAVLHLTPIKRWMRIEDLLREARIDIPDHIDELVFCESIPDVMVKNSRIKLQKWEAAAMLRIMQKIVFWLGLVHVSDLPMLAKRLYGFTVTMENLPLEDLKLCASVEETDGYLRWKSNQPVSSRAHFSPERLIADSDSQLHRLFRLVAEIPDIQLGQLEVLYTERFEAPIISCALSFKMYIDQHSEFSVANAKVALNVPLTEALREPRKLPATDLSRNLLSAQVPSLKPAESSKLSNTDTEEPDASNVCPQVLAPNIVSDNLNTGRSDSPSDVGTTSSMEAIYSESNLKQVELSFFGSLIGDRERELSTLCNDYKNKFKTRITEQQLEKLLLAAGYCCDDGRVHLGCKDRLRFLLSAHELDQTNVIIEFQALFGRSPCYTGTLRKYLQSIGCSESTGKRFRFLIRKTSDEPIDDQMLERLLPIIGFRNKSVDVLRVLEEYNCRHDPQITQETLLTELGKLDFVVLTRKKKAFDCGGIHECSAEAMEAYLREPGNTLSFPNLAQELREKTGKNLLYFGNLLKTLQKAGFNVSNDVVSQKQQQQQDTTAESGSPDHSPSSAHDLTEIRTIIKDLLRGNSPMTYDELETNFREASGYDLRYSQLGCSNFSSFLRVYLPDDGMIFEENVISCTDISDGSRYSSSRTSPARSSDQSCENVFDVIRASGPLLYPSELQARFAELTGTVLRIPDPDAYLLQLLRATELIVKSDQFGKIRVSMTLSCDCEEESFRSVEEEAAEEEEWAEQDRMDELVMEAMSQYL